MSYLAIVRHGLSEYNKKGLWAGWHDPDLTPEGIEQAKKAGEELKGLHFDLAFTSDLIRAKNTLQEILKVLNQPEITVIESDQIKEKSHGIYEGKNKWQIKEELGEELFKKIRKSWDYQPEKGESLKQVNERFVNFFNKEILPQLLIGKNILLVSSENAIRAFLKTLEDIDVKILEEIGIGVAEIYLYEIDETGKVISKEIRNKNSLAGKQ